MPEQKSNEGYNHDLENREQNLSPVDYLEETSAEIAAPMNYTPAPTIRKDVAREKEGTGGRGVGITALVISILSLFVMPILLGIVGIVLGFVARRRGAVSTGTWAISLGAISIIIGIFLAPFF
ncbi:DUF4190 domain-containing protein [Bacillus sp. B1-b2]|uniref:DUF4190 domain-containing protein n=1 Tax=Bacillus sp. B1-b2 TaxID=2653201 RepID=UPI0012623C75|nr:DUF4190 domain-containing protein [Bacillus sp. B1-b2]KAB7670050.1 DUF4190 domain-containing protein [Bacillus sp. B1-b2]